MGSFSLSGGVEVFGFISPSDTTDTYPVIDPLYGIDGLRNVDSLSDLNNIPTLRRRAGMVVGVSGGASYYKLNLPPWTNTLSDWSIFNSGGGSGSFSGGVVSGATIFTNGLTANTISATTYSNLPKDIFVTGGTYSGNTIIFTNNSGGTFNVSGISSFDTFVTGFSYSNNTLTITQNSGSSLNTTINNFSGLTINGNLNVTGSTYSDSISATTYQNLPTDIRVTGGTYSNGTATFTNNTGGTFNVIGFFTGSTDVIVTGATYNNNNFTFTNNTGGTFSVLFNTVSGLTINGNLSVTGTTSSGTISATTYQNLPRDVFVTGGTFGGGSLTFTNNTGGTFNVSGISSFDTFVTGFTYSNNNFTISQNSGSSLTANISVVTGLTINGNLSVTGTTSSNTISATTYQNLPTDIHVTGGTYSNGTTTFTNNTGGTFNVTGFFTGGTDVFVTGASYNNNIFTYTNNTGGTFNVLFNSVTGLTVNGNLSVTGTTSSGTISATTYQNLPTDIRVTGGTYSNGTATFTNNTGGTFNVTGFFTGGTDVFVTGATYDNNTFTYRNNTGGTFSVLFNTMTGLTINGNLTTTGDTIVDGAISGNTLFSTQSSGDEGGQIDLYIPQTNTSLSGASVSIDVYQNKFRIFESGSPNRGVYIDLTATTSNVGTNLLTPTFDYGKTYAIANSFQLI